VQYTRDYIQKLKDTGHSGTAVNYNCAINSLVKFAKRETVDVLAMTSKFVQNWIDWIGEQPTPKGKSGGRAASLYFACLRAMHKRAHKEFNDEERGIIRIPFNPFAKVDVPKPKPTRKRALTMEQLRAIASVERPDTWDNKRFNLSCDAFMLSFMLIGMNAADLYDAPASAFDGERITYKRKKTRTRRDDEAEISVKVEPEVIHLVENCRDPKGERLFRFCRLYSDPGTFNAALNKGLKQVGKALGIEDLEFYAARHSWATIATNEAGIDKYTVHEALNHVDPAMKVTDIYIKKNWSNIDKANRAVLDLVFGKK
jgi:integrase